MEFVKCEDCQCWDKEEGYNATKRDDWGFCRRRAPNSVTGQPKTAIYLFSIPFTKKVRSLGIWKNNLSFYSTFIGTPNSAGCWEGIAKDIHHE